MAFRSLFENEVYCIIRCLSRNIRICPPIHPAMNNKRARRREVWMFSYSSESAITNSGLEGGYGVSVE